MHQLVIKNFDNSKLHGKSVKITSAVLLYGILSLLGRYAALTGNSLPTPLDNISAPSSWAT